MRIDTKQPQRNRLRSPAVLCVVASLLLCGCSGPDLHRAATAGDVKTVEKMLEKGARADVPDSDGRTPLWYAAANRHENVVTALLMQGNADTTYPDRNGDTPLHAAARSGDRKILEWLVSSGIDRNAGFCAEIPNDRGLTPLDVAMRAHHSNAAAFLRSYALRHAVISGDVREARKLIADGADPNAPCFGSPPLHEAASTHRTEITRLLLDKGADVTRKDAWKRTALHLASCENAGLLLARGANAVAADELGYTPLHAAASRGDKELVKLLLSKGADVNVRSRDGSTPLLMAALVGNTEMADLLITQGADVNSRNATGKTPLHAAALYAHCETMRRLIVRGASVNAKDDNGSTPLCLALSTRADDLADLEAPPSGPRSYVPIALCLPTSGPPALGGRSIALQQTVELLLSKGADAACRNKRGETPLTLAGELRNADIIKVLSTWSSRAKRSSAARGETSQQKL